MSATRSKPDLRNELRVRRLEVPDQPARSMQIWVHVTGLPEVRASRRVLVFDAVPGEPDTQAFVAWCQETGKQVDVVAASPDAEPPPDPAALDVVIVPGLAFTAEGRRLGQGGGWYDRLLPQLRRNATAVGVCFADLLLDDLPVDPHDVPVDRVVTEDGVQSGQSSS